MWKAWAFAGLGLIASSMVLADEVDVLVLDGISFSAEHGNLRLVDGWGLGTRDDPYVVVEEIHGDGPAILTIRDASTRFGERARLGTGVGFVLQKIVTNRTIRPWTTFEMELREWLELPSGYFDGLSFGQAKERRGETTSSHFTEIEIHDEPSDRAVFTGATILPGETVMLQVLITDHSPKPVFYLFQLRDAAVAMLDRR